MKTYENNAAIRLLTNEANILKKVLNTANWEGYEESKRTREKALRQIEDAIKVIRGC